MILGHQPREPGARSPTGQPSRAICSPGVDLGGLVWQLLPLPGAGPSGRVCRQGCQVNLPRTGKMLEMGAAGDAPLPLHGCTKLCPHLPWGHSVEKLAGGKENP